MLERSEVDRLDEVSIEAGRRRALPVFELTVAAQGDDALLGCSGFQPARDLVTIDAG